MEKVITKNAEKDFNFAVTLCDGYKAGGTYTVKAASKSEAQEYDRLAEYERRFCNG